MPTKEAALKRAGDSATSDMRTTSTGTGVTARETAAAAVPPHIRRRATGLAALITALAFCVGDAVATTFPFGGHSRSVSDLGNQFVPFHVHLWDLLHGRADGDLLVNWQSGYGSSFLPDLGTYLSSPFALLVGLFPRDEIDVAVYVITVLKMASAGAAMAFLLLTLRKGRWWTAGALGASYALCGWSMAEASYNLMWLDGLIAFPLLCLVGEWALTNRRPVLGPLVVALAWTANFYTAYMATIGAALVLLLRLLLSREETRRKLAVLGRSVLATLLGIGLATPLILVVFKATKLAHPGRVNQFAPAALPDVLARLLPGTYTFETPAVWVGTAALLLALTLPFNTAVVRRERVGWSALVVLVLLSMQWKPTHLAWHAFATPNGSSYRQTFVLCGVLVIAGWLSLAQGVPRPRPLLGGVGLLAVVAAAGSFSVTAQSWTVPLLALSLAGVLGSLMLLRSVEARRRTARWAPVLAAALLVGAQVGESAVSEAWFDKARLGRLDDYGPWSQRQDVQSAAVARVENWPAYRTDPGIWQTVGNDPLVVGGQGAQYYSSLTSEVWASTLTALGGGYSSRGRSPRSIDGPVTDAIFSVGARLHSNQDPFRHPLLGPYTTTVSVSRLDVPPLVTVRPAVGPSGVPQTYGDNTFRNQEALLGAHVYTVPRVEVLDANGTPTRLTEQGQYGVRPREEGKYGPTQVLNARCPAGSEVFLSVPDFGGQGGLRGVSDGVRFDARPPQNRATVQPMGTVPASGAIRVNLISLMAGAIPKEPIGCLDRAALNARIAELKAAGATRVSVSGSHLSAELPPGSTGVAVIGAPAIEGWSCSAGGGAARPAGNHLGLLSVPLDGTARTISCDFTPPGLKAGSAVGGASALGLFVLAGYRWWSRRRAGTRAGSTTA
ncbi:YfhO family protein [Streptomyces sp. H10-C2]|uniref:YfhO family protein n=1 Tax=unclassified Streptomyces TaxID=2593676 RepID=UPI0024BB5737|nr:MULTISPECIES: YfhO family protein [unclassified Streptomyces]MDJ0342750.1 YfhO family protein [Streptomyces sp. PH10-H1]MDJ0372540.1 YfhO family protein [Streptomyces sp. H10-C2]